MSELKIEEISTKDSSIKHEVNPDLELQSFDVKTQENVELINYLQSSTNHRHFGNNLVCWFRRNEPILTLGPHCNEIYILTSIIL